MPSECLFCPMFTELFELGFGTGNGGFARAAFDALQGPANALSRLLATYLVVWTMLQFMLYEQASREVLQRSIKLITVLIAVGFFLSQGGGSWMFETVIMGLQNTALAVAQKVIATGVQTCATAGAGTYETLWSGVECVGFSPVRMAAENWAKIGWKNAIGGLGDWIAWLILAFPYLFVLGIFGAFLVQSMFYFLALAGTSPVILLFAVFDSTRGIVWSGLKFLLTGALTIVFAGMAMAFTGSVLTKYATNVASFQAYTQDTNSWACLQKGREAYQARTGVDFMTEVDDDKNPHYLAAFEELTRVRTACDKQAAAGKAGMEVAASDRVCGADHFVCTKSYWAAFLIGMISVLLHLLAPRIAANLSGASDSAATAAAVVGAGQFGAAKALSWGRNSAGWATSTATRAGGMVLGGGGLGGAVRSMTGLFGPSSAREAAQQARMMDTLTQLSVGVQNLSAAMRNQQRPD